jgi:hypothetical protein
VHSRQSTVAPVESLVKSGVIGNDAVSCEQTLVEGRSRAGTYRPRSVSSLLIRLSAML